MPNKEKNTEKKLPYPHPEGDKKYNEPDTPKSPSNRPGPDDETNKKKKDNKDNVDPDGEMFNNDETQDKDLPRKGL